MKSCLLALMLICMLNPFLCHQGQTDWHVHQQQTKQTQSDFLLFIQGCRKQLNQWVGFEQTSEQLITHCNINRKVQTDIFKMYSQWTEIDLSFKEEHFNLLRKYLRENEQLKSGLGCLIEKRNTQNQYLSSQQKKFKYFGKFIREHPNQGRLLFVQQQGMWREKGKKLCNFFKAFFEFYYLHVLRPSETLSTTFLRALTVRTDIFDHQDIAYCVDLDTHGALAQNLDALDINNIYLKLPQVFNAIRFIKFKKECKNQKSIAMMRRIQQRLRKVDMFKIMYHDYQPFVEVAAQKFGTSQIKLLARKFAHIIENVSQYEKYSFLEL